MALLVIYQHLKTIIKKVRDEFNSINYSNIIHRGCEFLYDKCEEKTTEDLIMYLLPKIKDKRISICRCIVDDISTCKDAMDDYVLSEETINLFIDFEDEIRYLILLHFLSIMDYNDFSKYAWRNSVFTNYELIDF